MLTITDVITVWTDIRKKVEECLVGQDYLPEEIYHLCRTGDATLLTYKEDVAVVQVRNIPFSNDRELFCLIAWGEGDAFDRHMPQLIEMGRLAGCSRFSFMSGRSGFERKLPKDWKKKFTVYELEI